MTDSLNAGEIRDSEISNARKYVEDRFGELPRPAKSYLVLMSPRSGSTLLCAHLQHIGYGNPIEAFHFNRDRIRRNYGWKIDFSNPYEYMRKALDFQTVRHVFGMKFNWIEFEIFKDVARQLTDGSGIRLSDAEFVEVFFPGAVYLHLKRRNKIEQAISYHKGMQSGIWAIPKDQGEDYKRYLMPAHYDRKHIEGCLDNLLAYDLAWERYLNQNRLKHIVIWYEELSDRYTQVMKDVHQFLEIDHTEIPAPPLKKLADTQSQLWFERFVEETPWLKNKKIAEALEKGDFATAFIQRSMMIAFQKEQRRWHSMPANRFKRLRTYLFRMRRKLNLLPAKNTQS